jgi:hypothetical protein
MPRCSDDRAFHRSASGNRAPIVDPETWHVPQRYFEADQLPETLLTVLRLICADHGPELIETAAAYHRWLDEAPGRPAGSIVSHDGVKANHQVLSEIQHVQQGVPIERVAMLDALIQHQRLTRLIDKMGENERRSFRDVLRAVGGDDIFALKLQRPMVRDDYTTVLG